MSLSNQRRREDGSVLVLVPVGFLVLVLLAAMAVDSAATYLAQQQLHDAVAAAANDAVTAGLADQSFYRRGELMLDPAAAGAVVCRAVGAQADADLHDLHLQVALGAAAIRVVATARVDAVFGRIVPGWGHRQVEAEATAAALTGPGATAPPPGALIPISCP